MSNEIIGINPGLDAEVAYRQRQMLDDAERQRLVSQARRRSTRPRLVDRFRARARRIVAARSGPVRQAAPTPLWR